MLESPKDIRAYIDGANLHKGVTALGWQLDYRRLRGWLRQKFGVTEAYVFIGQMAQHEPLYAYLRDCGYHLIFKEVTYSHTGAPKGNCDDDLVLKAARDHFEAGILGAVLVSSDGDYAPLLHFYVEKGVRCHVLSPAPEWKCSVLIKRVGVPILYTNELRNKLCILIRDNNKEAPGTDVSVQGSSSW